MPTADTVLKNLRAPDHGDLDILATVLPAAKKRGIQTICWLEDVSRPDLPGIEKVQERDLYGQKTPAPSALTIRTLATSSLGLGRGLHALL